MLNNPFIVSHVSLNYFQAHVLEFHMFMVYNKHILMRIIQMSKKLFLYLVVIGLATACAYYTIEFISERAVPLPFYGVDDHTVPSFEYTNQLGNTFSSEDHNDKIWIVDYFFTSCPTICPIMTKNLQEVHEYCQPCIVWLPEDRPH